MSFGFRELKIEKGTSRGRFIEDIDDDEPILDWENRLAGLHPSPDLFSILVEKDFEYYYRFDHNSESDIE